LSLKRKACGARSFRIRGRVSPAFSAHAGRCVGLVTRPARVTTRRVCTGRPASPNPSDHLHAGIRRHHAQRSKALTRGCSAKSFLEGRNFGRLVPVRMVRQQTGAVYISAYDDDGLLQGGDIRARTAWRDLPDLRPSLIPIGGGGLFPGSRRHCESKPDVRIIRGPGGRSRWAVRSFYARRRTTF